MSPKIFGTIPARWSGAALWQELLVGMAGQRVGVDGLIEGGVEVLHESLHPLTKLVTPFSTSWFWTLLLMLKEKQNVSGSLA